MSGGDFFFGCLGKLQCFIIIDWSELGWSLFPLLALAVGTHGFFFYGLLAVRLYLAARGFSFSLVPCMHKRATFPHQAKHVALQGCSVLMRFAAGGKFRANSASSIMHVRGSAVCTTRVPSLDTFGCSRSTRAAVAAAVYLPWPNPGHLSYLST